MEIVGRSEKRRRDFVEVTAHHRANIKGIVKNLGSKTITVRFDQNEKVDLERIKEKLSSYIRFIERPLASTGVRINPMSTRPARSEGIWLSVSDSDRTV